MFKLDNFNADGVEQVYQRCILMTGTTDASTDHVLLKSESRRGKPATPEQRWPVSNGHFKALALLAPGMNTVSLTSGNDDDDKLALRIRYVPLPKTPPLHLAILIAKDSPLSIDCPPRKFGTFSSTHSSLDAVIAKFRVTALMWQALIAEDMRKKDLGRRSFQLQEEWATDTLTRESVQISTTRPQETLGWVPQIHLVRTDKTVAELRHMDLAQPNQRAKSKGPLHDVFAQSLKEYGGPFVARSRPVVAGLVLDSHYDPKRNLVLGHEPFGLHEPDGLSLAVFGSHLTYAWPRFMDEIPECLLDARLSGESVSNENGQCLSLWETCAVSQRDFLCEVHRAFGGTPDQFVRSGDIIEWPKAFLSRTAYCHQSDTDGEEYDLSDPSWLSPPSDSFRGSLSDALFLRASRPHFKLPGDKNLPLDAPVIEIAGTYEKATISIRSVTKIRKVTTTQGPKPDPSFSSTEHLWQTVLDKDYITKNVQFPWGIKVLADNGVQTEVQNIWAHLHPATTFTIPGHPHITLEKKSVGPRTGPPSSNWHPWTVMLKKRDAQGKLVRASKIALHVGDVLDGAMVYYRDGSFATCGKPGNIPGGHQKRTMALKKGVDVTCVAVTRWSVDRAWWPLLGLRVWGSDGRGMGALNARHAGGNKTEFLTAGRGRRIVGFYGHHGSHGNLCTEFGIVTAPRGVRLPGEVYDVERWEVLTSGGEEGEKGEDEGERKPKRRRVGGDKDSTVAKNDAMELDDGSDSSSDGDGDDNISEDVDSGYDDFRRASQSAIKIYEELYKGKQYRE
ncbi:putative peptidase family-domain-containing protein [Apiosordaria backusii]|uniref:Peptidase family-domain-containing protein n=1 Tax=Apiosordaria backusii TaxID=314023 RepID=A0AA40ESG1_9PEZI|nr:putative peptidase family-domain-containing protein [Apiosordaria backusii]